MITSDQSNTVESYETELAGGASLPSPSEGSAGEASEEYSLWAEVLLRAVDDFKTYTAHRADPEENSVSKKTLRSILADGCDPEYWFFSDETGFDAVCLVLDIEPDVIRSYLREWMDRELDAVPTY